MKFGLGYWGLSSPVRRRKGWPSLTIVAMVATGLSSVVIAAGVATAPPASAGTPPAPPSGWTTTFSDSFSGANGSGPNYNNWFYDIGTGFGTGETEQMTSSTANCSVDGNGDLKLTAIESGGSWTSCRLESTLDNFYAPPGGEMEMEASIEQPNPPSGDGLGYWPAFWSLGSPGRAGGSWPTEGEIDMMEDVNAYNEASQTLHDSANSPGHPLIACPTTGCQTGFNTYAVLINRVNTSAEYLEFIMDGTVEDTITEASVGAAAWQDAIDHGFYIIFDLAMGGNYPNGECDCTTPTSSTASGYSMLVNWVAVYQTSSTSGLNCNGYQGAGCNASPGTPTASGEITQAGNCLGNVNNLNTEGNPIEVTACSGGSGQAVSLLSNSNIGLEGGCLDVVAAGTSPGSDVDWYPCNGTVAQDWTVETNGEIENPNSGLCLTNPANGSQLELEDCTGSSDQVWSVPSSGSGTTTTTTSPTTTTTSPTTTTTSPTTTTTSPSGANCASSTSGETGLAEPGFTASAPVPSGASGAQNPVTNAVKGNTAAGRFTTGADQAVGDEYVVNMGKAETFNEVEMAVPDYATDYAHGYEVEVSSNGSSYSVVATCAGTGTPEVVSFPAQTAQYIQVVLTTANPSYWWSMEYFYVYSSSGTTTTTAAPTTTTTLASTTTTAATTTTTAASASCSASTSGQTQLNEAGFTSSTADVPDASGAQNAITNAVNHSDPDRFTSGADQASGMTYEVNMGSAQTVDEVDMYVPDYAGDYPRGYNVEVSSNGTSWTTVASCTASAQPTIVSFSARSEQYLEVVLTAGSTTKWWSIEQFLIYDN